MQINLDTLIKNIKTMVIGSVIKYNKLAKTNETLESLKASDIYLAAREETDSFITYPEFHIDAIINAGLVEPQYNSLLLSRDKNKIPEEFRNAVVKEQRKIVIRDYVELNDYYRMLIGLPPRDTTPDKFLYLTDEEYAELGLPRTPLHELSADVLFALYKEGKMEKFDKYKKTHPYIDFLGHNKIDLLLARRANNFSLLKINRGLNEEFYTTFVRFYDQNREYFSTVIYNLDIANRYEYFDSFIGFCIMIMTIQRLVSNTFKFGIERNFFDWSFIKAMYKMYNIPLIEDLGMDYHIIILKNLNNLLRHKSTDKVLFDILSLLGYDRMQIFKYFLVKQQKMDSNGEPIFVYKEIPDPKGTGKNILVEDHQKMYDLYFQAVDIRERNIALAIMEENNRKKYLEVTSGDPYWWKDADLEKVEFESEYNYVESKYLSMNLMYKMTEMLFEITYAFRMIMDKKEDTIKLPLAIPKVYQEKVFNLYDIIIFMVCLLCKKNGFGNQRTILDHTEVAHIYGFNFDPDEIAKVKQIIADNADKLDAEKVAFLTNLKIESKEDANLLFENIKTFHNYLARKILDSQTYEDYRLYKKIFDIIRITKNNNDVYRVKSTGQPATSYIEFLRSHEPILADIVDNADNVTINDILEHVLATIDDYMNSMEYIHILNDNNSPVFKSIQALVQFFKSYTVDLTSFNIVYLFDSKFYNSLKLIEDIRVVHTNMKMDDSFNFIYSDLVNLLRVDMGKFIEKIKMYDWYRPYLAIQFRDKMKMRDRLYEIRLQKTERDKIKLKDMEKYRVVRISSIKEKKVYKKDIIRHMEYGFPKRDKLKIRDNVKSKGKIRMAEDFEFIYRDEVRMPTTTVGLKEKLKLKDWMVIVR